MNASIGVAAEAMALRQAFDQAFAEAPGADSGEFMSLLLLGVAGTSYAVRRSDIAGIRGGRKTAWLPSPTRALLGIAAFRGVIVPVYDLRALLGHAPGEEAYWIVLVGSETRLGLAFDDFEGQLRVPANSRASMERIESKQRHVFEIAHAGHVVRPIIHIPSVIEAIRRPLDSAAIPKER